MKNKKILKFVVLLALFIPAYLAIYKLSIISSDKLTVENITKVVVTGANKTQYEYSDRNAIKIYIQIVGNATLIENSLRPADLDPPFVISFYKGQKQINYDLYLSRNTDNCLLESADSELFLLRAGDAEKLLSTPLSDSLYKYSNVPMVQVIYEEGSNNDIIEAFPSEGNWYLKKPDGSFNESNVQNIFKSANDIRVTRGNFIDFNFGVQPDLLNVSIYDNKELIFQQPYESFGDFAYDTSKELQYVLEAEWYQSEYIDYYGKAKYTFNVEYNVPPTFEISKYDAEPGEIITVSALNMSSEDVPIITTDMGYTANFLKIGEKHVALLPVSIDFMGNKYNVEVSGSASAEDKKYEIYVNPKTYNSASYGAQDTMFNAHRTSAALASKETSYKSIFASDSPDAIYWADEQFVIPHQGDIKVNYGWTVSTNGVSNVSRGINIAVNTGDVITASNAGRVVFAESVPDDGNLIVIDHGGGVRSWYGHLDAIYVSVGDTVSKGQEIGDGGSSGFYTSLGKNLYFAISVHNAFVDPVSVIENGILPN